MRLTIAWTLNIIAAFRVIYRVKIAFSILFVLDLAIDLFIHFSMVVCVTGYSTANTAVCKWQRFPCEKGLWSTGSIIQVSVKQRFLYKVLTLRFLYKVLTLRFLYKVLTLRFLYKVLTLVLSAPPYKQISIASMSFINTNWNNLCCRNL